MVKIKVCGFTNPEDAEMVSDMGVDMVGVIVNVSVSTPREISIERAKEVLGPVKESVGTVVVTMPETLGEVWKLSEELDPDYVQIHSQLSQSKLREIKREVGKSVIGVSPVPQNSSNLDDVVSQSKRIGEASDLVLLDTKSVKGGGTGEVHDWSVSSSIREALETPVILAGGLDPFNVQEAIRGVNPFAVDVASGVESEPGIKDFELVKKFIQRAGG